MILIVAQFDFPPASSERILAFARDMDRKTNEEDGCIHYRHARDVSNDNRLILSEVWRDADALSAHFRSEHFRGFFAAGRELGIQSTLLQLSGEEVEDSDAHHWRTLLRAARR